MNIVIIGSAYPLRGGGLATFNERLAQQFQQDGHNTTIYTFSLQYPKLLFPGTSQYSTEPAPEGLSIKVCINSINPFNWLKIGKELKRLKPDLIIIRYWLPFMAPCFGTILRIVKKNKHTKIISVVDNMIPHEPNFLDKPFTKYFIKPVDAFVAMSEKVFLDIKTFTQKKAIKTFHPLYDNFGEKESKTEARKFLGIDANQNTILFFGFIRKYKGLDLLLGAMALLKQKVKGESTISNESGETNNHHSPFTIHLLIAGEFYTDEKYYQELIDKLGIREDVILKTHFIPNSEVRHYLCAADFVIQPYKSATQSGVTPLAYHFEKPMLVTNVGGLPDMVPNEKAGIVCEPDAASIAQGIEKLYALGENYFLPNLIEEKKKYSWAKYTETIIAIAHELP